MYYTARSEVQYNISYPHEHNHSKKITESLWIHVFHCFRDMKCGSSILYLDKLKPQSENIQTR